MSASSEPEQTPSPAKRPLTRQEVVDKLDDVPVFNLVNSEGEMFGRAEEGGRPTATFYVDLAEARAALAQLRDLNPSLELRIGITPLGTAFALSEGWNGDPGVTIRVAPPAASVASVASTLAAMPPPGPGVPPNPRIAPFPLFLTSELRTAEVMPVFTSRDDLEQWWAHSEAGAGGRPPPAGLTVLELRTFLYTGMMRQPADWSAFAFVGSQASVRFALQAQAAADGVAPTPPEPEPALPSCPPPVADGDESEDDCPPLA